MEREVNHPQRSPKGLQPDDACCQRSTIFAITSSTHRAVNRFTPAAAYAATPKVPLTITIGDPATTGCATTEPTTTAN
jgi:hypothetical protein